MEKKDYATELKYELLGKARELIWGIDFDEMKHIDVEIDDTYPDSTGIRIYVELNKDKQSPLNEWWLFIIALNAYISTLESTFVV